MPFREKQPLYGAFGAFETFDKVVMPAENGECQVKLVSNNQKLPDASMTDLELQLNAGVNLEQVNTKFLPGNAVQYGMQVVNDLIVVDSKQGETKKEEMNNED